MKAELISVGTELLMGYVVNSNASDIAKQLLAIGIGTYYQQTVGDNWERLTQALALAHSRSDLVILTGGLGPTHDDITKQVVAAFVGTTLEEDPRQLAKLEQHLAHEGRECASIDLMQVLTLKGGKALWNAYGLACGSVYQHEGVTYILLPGPPYEMNQMLKQEVLPDLAKQLGKQEAMESLYLNFFGIGESKLAQILAQPIAEQSNPTLGLYAKPRHIAVRLTANAATSQEAHALNQALAQELIALAGDYYMGQGEDFDFAGYVLGKMAEGGQRLVSLEGFTYGQLASRLRQQDPESAVYQRGYIQEVTAANLETSLASLSQDLEQGTFYLANYQLDQDQAMLILVTPSGKRIERPVYLGQRPYEVQASIVVYEALSLLHKHLI